MTSSTNPTAPATSRIFIPKGTVVNYSFWSMRTGDVLEGTVELTGDCYITGAAQETDGSWTYGLSPDRSYNCPAGAATVLPPYPAE